METICSEAGSGLCQNRRRKNCLIFFTNVLKNGTVTTILLIQAITRTGNLGSVRKGNVCGSLEVRLSRRHTDRKSKILLQKSSGMKTAISFNPPNCRPQLCLRIRNRIVVDIKRRALFPSLSVFVSMVMSGKYLFFLFFNRQPNLHEPLLPRPPMRHHDLGCFL